MSDTGHEFGGDWTEEKLKRVAKYLNAYTTALKKQRFRKLYIDAFAGTGYRGTSDADDANVLQADMFADADAGDSENMKSLLKGSARLALEVEPPFDEYHLIEANRPRWNALKGLATEFPDLVNRINFVLGDANEEVTKICKNTAWGNKTRAVAFLDPFGAQVDWKTIEVIAATEAIDLWYLFPLMAVVRMTPRDGNVPRPWAERLDKMLGDTGWREAFYARDSVPDLFGDHALHKTTQVNRVEQYLLSRLRTVFPAVSKKVLRLPEEKGRTMFLLVFACANPKPKAMGLALKIAGDILGR